MVGAGFYALIGRVAGLAEMSTPIALGFSGLLAMLSAASFAELSSISGLDTPGGSTIASPRFIISHVRA